MACATNSLPVPVSPSSKAVESNGATFCTNSSTRCNAGLFPTICWQPASFSNRPDISVEAPDRISRRGCSSETFATKGNSLYSAVCKEASLIFSTVAKAVLIVVWSFPGVAQDCAASFIPGQLLKCDGLHKYGRLWVLFGVTAEVLSRVIQMSLIVWGSNLNSLPTGTPRIHRPTPWAQQRQSNAEAYKQHARPRIMGL